MKIIIIFSLFVRFLFSEEYPNFSSNELSSIKKSFGQRAINRIDDYYKKISSLKNETKKLQLIKTNLYLNSLLSQYDKISNNQEDYWSTPKEFLKTGFGDCEDYVIIKYFTLINLGFDEKKLFFTIVKENILGGYHMVLSYFKDENKPPLILDNLSFRILDLKVRKDLQVNLFINSKGSYTLDTYSKLVKVSDYNHKYENLLMRIHMGN